MGKDSDSDSGGEEGKASGTSDQPPSPMLNPLPIPHHPTGTALTPHRGAAVGVTPAPPHLGHHPQYGPSPLTADHCLPAQTPPTSVLGCRGATLKGQGPIRDGFREQGGQEWGCTCPRGAGEQSRGKEQLEQEPIQHLPGQPWVEAVLAPVEAETTAPPAPASIAASTKSRSEPLEPPALALSTGTGAEAGASVMSFWGQE